MVKIISTISPKTAKLNGIDVGRINCAFGSRGEIVTLARKIKQEWSLTLLLDLPINRKKIRTNTMSPRELIDMAKDVNPDYVALSYVKSESDVRDFKNNFSGTAIKVVSKVEAKEALDDLDGIISASDAVMIDRGDLAVAIGMEKLHREQKRIIRKCNEMNKKVIVATEFLMSMMDKNAPTKSEIVDISNAISDGADFVMLSEETAIGNYSQHSVDVMRKIINELEDKYKVILLSAGASAGMRDYHSCLIDLGGTTILQEQLKAISACNINEEDIIICTGKGDAALREFVHGKFGKVDIEFVYNPWYENSNMLVTLWLAREFMRKGALVVYGDVLFEAGILQRVIKNDNDIVLAVEKKACDAEDEKVCVKDMRMVLSARYDKLVFPKHKTIPADEAYGEFIGIAKFSRWAANILINEIDEMIRKQDLKNYLVEAFEHLVKKGYTLTIEDIGRLLWSDNDTPSDLKITAEKILPRLQSKYKR